MARDTLSPLDLKIKDEIVSKLHELKKERGVSQKEIVEGSGVSQALVSHYYNGRRMPTQENLKKIADYFGISVEDLDPRQVNLDFRQDRTDEQRERLLSNYDSLDEDNKTKLVDYSNELVDERYLKLVRENAAANDGKLHNQRTEKSEKAKARFLKETGLIDENNL